MSTQNLGKSLPYKDLRIEVALNDLPYQKVPLKRLISKDLIRGIFFKKALKVLFRLMKCLLEL